ncbi:M48 family metallopeptidase [Thermosipho atlanticus]|uniref:STE24 endopeptidase n=1 Tax=Thermosipho atlanticus DSM 15807 TaxID=1123380 RepID=A0A1M5RQT5_9BACT|nr:M48 family metallopeptidase [Thermosipho atlanticus]SHH28642.1 STE24 endopeptidase [Thermosipho atlanticus DSM 15807]
MFYIIFLFVIVFEAIWEVVLGIWNMKYSTSSTSIPEVLKDKISEKDFERSKKYLKDTTRVKVASIILNLILTLVFIFWGFPYFESLVSKISNSVILQGLIFFGIYWVINILVNLPIKMYSNFIVEEKYGFNTMTYKTFIADTIKNMVVSIVLFTPLIALLIWILKVESNWWWKVSLVFIAFQLFVTMIYPIFIAPIFNKFTPLEDGELKKKINKLLKTAQFKVSDIYVMDASKRTKKQNAYLTGIGKSKKLVLYDTILDYSQEEILAIVAHELGHNVKKHIPKLLIIVSIFYTLMIYLVNVVYNYILSYHVFNVSKPYSVFIYAFIFISSAISFIVPIVNYIQRKFEYEADAYSAKLVGTTDYLISSLKRLIKENLSNINPLPLYKIWHYNHPSPEERIKRLYDLKI